MSMITQEFLHNSQPDQLTSLDEENINQTKHYLSKVSGDLIIISGNNEEIKANKYLLHVFSSVFGPLLSSSQNTIHLENCSTFNIKYFINMVNNFIFFGDNVLDSGKQGDVQSPILPAEDVTETFDTSAGDDIQHIKEEKKYVEESSAQCKVESINTFQEDIKNEEVPGTVRIMFCFECDKDISLDPGETLAKHVNQVHKAMLSCPHCKMTTLSDKRFKGHIEKKHPEEKSEFLCCLCGDVCSSLDAYFTHQRSHKIPPKCHLCEKIFDDMEKLKGHHINTHINKNKKDMCPYCGKSYKSIQIHLKIHTNEMQKCNLCDYTNKQKSQIKNHIVRVHKSNGESCETCGKLVKDLRRHKKSGCISSIRIARTILCEQCDKKFLKKQHLQRHMKIHLNIRDKVCSQCTYRTTSGFNLRIHIKRVHQNLPLRSECEHCMRKVFNLEKHIQNFHKLITY